MECPPTKLEFRQTGASWRRPLPVFANIAGKHFVDRRGGFYILPPQRKVTFSFPLLGFLTLLFLLREHPVSRNHSGFRKAKNCEAPWGEYFLPPASNTTAGIFYMTRERCAAGAKKSPSRRMGFGLPGAPAQKKKKQKENAIKEMR